MEEKCNEYTIIASAWHIMDLQQWQPMPTILWRDGRKVAITYPVIRKYFPTEIDAEREGLEFAKKWIQDHKPQPFLTHALSPNNIPCFISSNPTKIERTQSNGKDS